MPGKSMCLWPQVPRAGTRGRSSERLRRHQAEVRPPAGRASWKRSSSTGCGWRVLHSRGQKDMAKSGAAFTHQGQLRGTQDHMTHHVRAPPTPRPTDSFPLRGNHSLVQVHVRLHRDRLAAKGPHCTLGPPTPVTWGCSASLQVGRALGYHPDVGVLPAGIPGCRTFGFSDPAVGGADRGMSHMDHW